MKFRGWCICGCVLTVLGVFAEGDSGLISFVDPFIGCAANGHTFPGPTMPFGMVQPGPDTGNCDWQHCSGYVFADTNIYGFSQTHLNGTGCSDMGDVRLLPFVGPLPEDLYSLKGLSGRKDAASERAEVGYYSVRLPDLGVGCEIAAGQRVAFHRWTRERDGEFHVLLDPQWALLAFIGKMEDHVLAYSDTLADDKRTIYGGFCHRAWLTREVHFRLVFDRPYRCIRELPSRRGEKARRYVLDFDLAKGESLNARISISTTDDEGAKSNLEAERAQDFDTARRLCREAWNGLFSRVRIEGVGRDRRTTFYTSLYHLFIQPNDIADADGRYRGPDGKVHRVPAGSSRYSGYSLWDTFRAAHPLYTLLVPERVDGFVDSLLDGYRCQGFLPVIEYGGCESYCMIGNHSVPVVVDAYLKGFRGFDAKLAYEAVTNSLTVAHRTLDGGRKPKEDWNVLDRFGYYPFDLIVGEGVSRTLECAYDDACAARFAKAVGDAEGERFFSRRAMNWTNVLDRSIGLVRGRDSHGKWREPFDPYRFGGGGDWDQYDCTEANAWQYTWHVMQDPNGLIAALGGRMDFVRRLDSLFTLGMEKNGWAVRDMTGRIGQYVHGNEPSHHSAYLYPFAGCPDRTAEIVREVCDRFYMPKVDGLCGNDDCGQMSAWYVFACLGFYPLDPCGGDYVLGAPQAAEMTVLLSNGRRLSVVARGLSGSNRYVRRVLLDGRLLAGFMLNHVELTRGGELVFEMCDRREVSQ